MKNKRYAYLENTSKGHDKYYEMKRDNNDPHRFNVRWGKIGTTLGTTTYDMFRWSEIYNQKVSKGYIDVTRSKEDDTINSTLTKFLRLRSIILYAKKPDANDLKWVNGQIDLLQNKKLNLNKSILTKANLLFNNYKKETL